MYRRSGAHGGLSSVWMFGDMQILGLVIFVKTSARESYYNLRKDGRSHLRLSGNYSLERGPKKSGFCMGVGVIVRQELMKSLFG